MAWKKVDVPTPAVAGQATDPILEQLNVLTEEQGVRPQHILLATDARISGRVTMYYYEEDE